jgi:hypothetical protein
MPFLDSSLGGAWPLLVGGVICLADSDNVRDHCLPLAAKLANVECDSPVASRRIGLTSRALDTSQRAGLASKNSYSDGDSRSVMPLDALGCTRTTMVM